MRDDGGIDIDPFILNAFRTAPWTWMAPGVAGTMRDEAEQLTISMVIALEEGSGDVGRFLDTLPADRKVRVTTVVSDRLAGMLQRRGFTPDAGDWCRG